MDGLGAPDQGASQGPKKPLGLLGQEINLTMTAGLPRLLQPRLTS